jgi:large subunit ribosomal protein L4
VVIDVAEAKTHKTKALAGNLKAMGFESLLVIDGTELNENFVRAARNIPLVDVLPAEGANVYDIIRRNILVLTKSAVTDLEARLK